MDRPCRWLVNGHDPEHFACGHNLTRYFNGNHPRAIGNTFCHGCPCHEPPAKDTQRTDPMDATDHVGDTNKMVHDRP